MPVRHATGVYWAADCYSTAVERGTAFVSDLDPEFWADGFRTFQIWNSPWVSMLDHGAYADACRRIEALDITAIATAHGPTIGSASVAEAHGLMRRLPDSEAAPQPGQPLLDEIVAAIGSAA